MKGLFKFLLYTTIVLIVIFIASYLWLYSTSPDYSGSKKIKNLSAEVSVNFDSYGVPHIKTSNGLDAYRVLGYLHASERQFQMELLRRAGSGQLSELLGKDLIEADIMFHTMGLPAYADQSAELFRNRTDQKILDEINAYLDGINQSLANEARCPEFMLLGYKPEPYTLENLFHSAGYMAFSFALGQRTDPLAEWIGRELGPQYLVNTGLEYFEGEKINDWLPAISTNTITDASLISMNMKKIQDLLPMPGFEASNSWAVSGKKSRNGKPILCNDTHIKHGVPNTWYEAQISCDEFSIYGNFLPGIPYCLIGHSGHHAWGITMLENDDLDFYIETISKDGTSYEYNDSLYNLHSHSHILKIKDHSDTVINWKSTSHGPLVTNVFMPAEEGRSISMWWDYTKSENFLLEAIRKLNFAKDIREFESGLSLIHSPGLNVQYADTDDHIAWWAVAKLLKRPAHINSMLFIEGNNPSNEPLGYYLFEENPRIIDPERGYIYSANEQPGMLRDSTMYPGYYKSGNRSYRIHELLEIRDDWNGELMKAAISDVISPVDACIGYDMAEIIKKDLKEEELRYLEILLRWDGSHEQMESAPIIYYKWIYHFLRQGMMDELGEERFSNFLTTHWMLRSLPPLINNPESAWWDDISTEQKENQKDILLHSFRTSIEELEAQLGQDLEEWQWGSVRHLLIEHPMGKIAPLGMLFNVGPEKIKGSGETIAASGFALNASGFYEVHGGSQMRIVHDLIHPDSSWSIMPLGQSGHPMSPHFSDQFREYCSFKFRQCRYQLTDSKDINSTLKFKSE